MPDTVLPVAPVMMIPNVQLEEIEKAVYERDYEKASQLTLIGLRKLKQGGLFIGYAPNEKVLRILFSRFASAVIALLSDPKFGLSQEGFDHFASEHAILDVAIRASVFETSDHLLPALAANPSEQDRSKLQITDGGRLVKFMVTYSLRSCFGLNFEETFRKNPQVMFSLWAGMISPLLTVATQAHERRELLLGLYSIFEDVTVPDGVLPTLADSYMYTSYGVRRDKHDAKAMIHRLLRKMLVKRNVKLPGDAYIARRRSERVRLPFDQDGRVALPAEKPTILICTEWFTHLHAMFRCYAPIIRQLRSRFRLVGMSRAIDIDDIAKREFDEWHEVKGENLILDDLVRKIVTEIQPDIIYYPSLGMAMWWVIMASTRLAPIQMMSLGHPASSRSPFIDYVVCETTSIGDPALFTERIVQMPPGSTRFVMRPDVQGIDFAAPYEYLPDTVRIAIPAMLCKLNAPFMATLREIVDAPRPQPVELHFFINMIGVNYLQATREIQEWFPTAVVHARSTYSDYMKALQRCHLHLCTFPFGGTNSNIDSMLLGIPILAMEGDQPHERFDAVMVRQAGLPELLVAKSQAEYVAAAQQLIDEPALRSRVSRLLRDADLQHLFFDEPPPDRKHAFLDAVTTIYEQHEALQVSDRVITIPARET